VDGEEVPESKKRMQPGVELDGAVVTKADAAFGKGGDGEDISTYTAKYTFGDPKFQAFNLNEAGDGYTTFSLVFDSKQMCQSDTTRPFQISFINVCDDDTALPLNSEDKVAYDYISHGYYHAGACNEEFIYQGKYACSIGNWKPIMNAITSVQGAIEIVGGAVLCFHGVLVLTKALTFLCFFTVAGFCMLAGEAFFDFYSDNHTPLICTGVIAVIAGAIAAYFFYKVVDNYGTALLGFVGGVTASFLLLSKVNSNSVKLVIAIIAGIVGFFVGKRYDQKVKAYGTAFVGSFLLVHGISQYVGGFPPLMTPPEEFRDVDKDTAAAYIGYLVGFVVLFIAGACVQKRLSKGSDNDVFSEA